MKTQKIIAIFILSISFLSISLMRSSSTAGAAFNLPEGELDPISCATNGVTGFAFDEDVLPGHTWVSFFIDGAYRGAIKADAARSDYGGASISGDHGFVWTIPGVYKDGNSHNIKAYAINTGSLFGHPKIGSLSFTCTQPLVTLGLGGSFNESNGSAALSANLDKTHTEDITVNLAFSGEAVWNIDFTGPNKIVIPAGQLTSSITISSRDDNLKETREEFTVDISSVTNGVENGVQKSIFAIVDDDPTRVNGLDIIAATSDQDVQNFFEGTFLGPGVIATDYSKIGSYNQFGTFSNGSGAIGSSRLPLDDGVVFVAGDVTTASADSGNTSGSFSSTSDANASDPDLVALSGSSIYDAAGFEFKFESVTDRIGFVFSFASDEYPEYVGTIFNDAFGFFIQGGDEYPTKKNVSLVPGSNDGIAVNTINEGHLGTYAASYGSPSVLTNSNFFISNSSDHTVNTSVGPYIQYDGLTTRLVVDAPITRNTVYSIKIALGDAGDANWDSAVFFETNGFLALTSATDNDYAVSKTSTVAGNVILDETGDGIDIDPEDGTATLSVIKINDQPTGSGNITLPSGALLKIAADGSFTYDPSTSSTLLNLADGQTATETFTYTIVDDIGITDSAVVTIVVSGSSVTQISCQSNGYLLNTGFNSVTGDQLSAGQLDAGWEVAVGTSAGPNSASNWHPAWVLGQKYSIWTPSPLGNSEWVGFNSDGAHFGNQDYFYRHRFDLDGSVGLDEFILNVDFFADNSIEEIYVNGVPQSQYGGSVSSLNGDYYAQGYRSNNGIRSILRNDWKTGSNEILVHVKTSEPSEGFLAQVKSSALCPPAVTLTGGGEMMETGGVKQAALTLSEVVDFPVTVSLGYSGQAIHDTDFTGATEIVIPAGQQTVSFDLTAIQDNFVEGEEEFTIEIVEIINGVQEGEQIAVFTIIDVPPVDFTIEAPDRISCGARAPINFITTAGGQVSVESLVHTLPDGFELDENLTSITEKAKVAYGSNTTVEITDRTITLSNLTIKSGTTTFALYVIPVSFNLAGGYEFVGTLTLPGTASPITSSDTISLSVDEDNDSDGIPDCQDRDDDNDGILDTIECGVTGTSSLLNGGFEEPTYVQTYNLIPASQILGWETDASSGVIEIWESGYDGVFSHSGGQHAEINAYTNAALYQDVASDPGQTMDWTFAHRGRGGDDVVRLEIGPPGGPYVVMGEYVTAPSDWSVYSGEYSVPGSQSATRFRLVAISTGSGSGGVGNFADSVEFYACSLDTDDDGVIDKFDLDSDNDGITDLRESGQNPASIDQNEDGIRDDMDSPADVASNDTDRNGLADPIDNGNEIDPFDSDDDDVADYVDIDADNDGIPDHVEAQSTRGYENPSSNVDRNGVSNIYTPVDTDDDDTPDYLDRDSDNDTLPDIEENGLANSISGSDSDGDGLDDTFEGDIKDDPLDVNDEIDIPSIHLPDNDLDYVDGGDVDYRDDSITITGLVWDDDNLDGIRQDGEALFSDIPVALYDSADVLIDSINTDSAGNYELTANVSALLNGYYVEFTRPTNYLFTIPNVGETDRNSDPDPFSGETNRLQYPTFQFIDAGIFYELLDHGDAPASYGDSYTAAGLPYESLWIGGVGDLPDTELTLPDSNGALGDNLSGSNDEQGVTFVTSESNSEVVYYLERDYELDITVYNPRFDTAYLEAWIDFNGNNEFDSNEIIVSRQINKSATPQLLSGLSFTNPADAACGDTYARFRLAATQLPQAYGYAGFGETEDYRIFIDCRTDLQIKATVNPTPTVKLSNFVDFDVSVINNGPNPARQMTVDFTYPISLTDEVPVSLNGWECSFGESRAACSKTGLAIGDQERVFTFKGRVPGTYRLDIVEGSTSVSQAIEDLDPTNNALSYLVDVIKEWGTAPDAQNVEEVFMYTRYNGDLDISSAGQRDFPPNELVVNPLNIPIDVAFGIETSSYPTLTTAYCAANDSAIGCNRGTDIITGTIRVQSYEITAVTLQSSTGGSNGLASSSQIIELAPDGTGRYADPDPANCLIWQGELGGYCQAPYLVTSPWGGYGDGGNADLYAWTNPELTQLIFESSGGRSINCDPGVGDCQKFEDAKPGIYIMQGTLNLTTIFHDPVAERLGEPTLLFPSQLPFSFYIQILAPFTEAEQ